MFKFLILSLLIFIFILRYIKQKKGYANKNDPYIKPMVYNDLITKDEADYILNTNSYEDSKVVGGGDTSKIRTSKTKWISRDDPVISGIYKRLSEQFKFDVKKTESSLQVVKYEPGQFYREHHDSCCDDNEQCDDFSKDGGQRKMTILIYLNDDFEGGYTNFPELDLKVRAPKYGGIVFYPLEEGSSRCHPLALHSGMDVLSGTKYVCNIWIREYEI